MAGAALKVLGQAATGVEPGDRPFHNPAFGYNNEAFDLRAPGDDYRFELGPDCGEGRVKPWALIGPIREQLGQQWKPLREGGEWQPAPVSILDVSGMNKRMEQ